MKIKDLNGKSHIWNPAKYMNNRRANASSLHLRAVAMLHEVYPAIQILEEVYLPGMELFVDIYIPNLRLMIEVDGQQHAAHSNYFHGRDPKNFNRAKYRDSLKEQWCNLNNIRLVRFNFDEDEEQWKAKL